MDDNVLFLRKPECGEDYPWSALKEIIEGQVKTSGPLPEDAPGAVAERMRPDVLRWVERAQEISPGICPEERDRLSLLVAEVLVDRIEVEMELERERRRA